MTEVTKDVGLARIVKPKFLTLVGRPANQVAFKVIRDDNGETTMTAPHIQRKRVRRAEPLISIEFEVSVSDEQIQKTMADWGVSEFNIETVDDKKRVRCSDAPDGAETMNVKLNDCTATILKPISQRADTANAHIAVAAIEFAADYFPDPEDISAWCKRSNIDFSNLAVENGAQQTVARRGVTVAEGAETRKIEVDGGVQFVVARADSQDIPEDFVTVINDAAYGCWGWGQLDFAATMADVEFCEMSQEAVYTLNRVVDRILFYSDMPITLRKELVVNATTQFADYIVTLMDALPARVVVANRSILEKEKLMSKDKGQDGQAVERQDQTGANDKATEAGAATGATDAAEAKPNGDGITRADVEKMIGDAMTGISTQLATLQSSLAAPAQAEAQRSDGTTGEQGDKSGSKEDASGETLLEVLRSIKDLGESVKGVAERVQSLEGSTVVRSDAADDKQQATQRKDVFKGMFGSQK